nr:unnamed protein product [Ipomoea batatas]
MFKKDESFDLQSFCASMICRSPFLFSSLAFDNDEKNWCIEINTIEIPKIKFIVKVWPNNKADAIPVKIVATVDEYFFRIIPAYLKKKEDRIPCAALLQIKSIVALECPCKISKLSGPKDICSCQTGSSKHTHCKLKPTMEQ